MLFSSFVLLLLNLFTYLLIFLHSRVFGRSPKYCEVPVCDQAALYLRVLGRKNIQSHKGEHSKKIENDKFRQL